MNAAANINSVKKTIETEMGKLTLFHLGSLGNIGIKIFERLPYSIKVLLENVLRNCDGNIITLEDVQKIANWSPTSKEPTEIAFYPGRVLLQDFTGVPCVVDLAAMRSAMKRLGGDHDKINPMVACDLIIDHSVQTDAFGSREAFNKNIEKEFERNNERYQFLKWGQNVFKNFTTVPPGTGIVHQINLEYLAKGVLIKDRQPEELIAYPDSLVGTDSHTTMINGLGIVGWGVGGIEAEAVMLGEPVNMLLPEVVGFKLTGKLDPGVTATDLVLTVVEMLRKKGVVEKFVEFCGDGLRNLSLPDRATVSNMSPEYGSTIGFMPVDDETLNYYRMTGRDPKLIALIEQYMKEQGMFNSPDMPLPEFSDMVELNLADVKPCLAGPKRPQDRIALNEMKKAFHESLVAPVAKRGFGLKNEELSKSVKLTDAQEISHGSAVIASITSCTNTSNPSVLIGAGLLAKNAVEKGLTVPSYVKTSFAPGSQVVDEYMWASKLLGPLEKLGFHIIGYGCATCIGNSGPLSDEVSNAIKEGGLVAASVLSGNRNFEGRINPLTKANYLASPPLVVAYALAGTVDIDLTTDPLGKDNEGNDVYLKNIWPNEGEINQLIEKYVTADAFTKRYGNVTAGNENWNAISSSDSPIYEWEEKSTYIQEPPFFDNMTKDVPPIEEINKARVLVMVGDSITTDHISPAGAIAEDSPAGEYLKEQGIAPKDFNSYGSRRGNDKVMTRGTFANIRLRNLLAPGTEGSHTTYFPAGEVTNIYDAAQKYKNEKTPLIVLAGKEYGTGSSRDWAAKGTALLGVRVVIAQSYERIHRSNLAGMGILPLQFKEGESCASLSLKGDEIFDFHGINASIKPRQEIIVTATLTDGTKKEFATICRLDTPAEIDYFNNGGILQTVLRKMLK